MKRHISGLLLNTVVSMVGALSLSGCGARGDVGTDNETEPQGEIRQAAIGSATTSQTATDFRIFRGSTTAGTATCPTGSRVVAGGYNLGAFPGLRVIDSRPNGNGWQIKVVNNNPDFLLMNATVYAECLSGTRATAMSPAISAPVTLTPGAGNCAAVSCPGSGVFTGVGFASSSAFELEEIFRSSDGVFHVCGLNNNPSQAITAQAIGNCLGGVTGGVRPESGSPRVVQVPPSTQRTTRVDTGTCPGGVPLGFGVMSGGDQPLTLFGSTRSSNIWRFEVFNPTTTTLFAAFNGYCLDLFQ